MYRVLIVDDEEVNRYILGNILEEEYVIDTAENGKQALLKLKGYESDTAAVLLDLHMPEMDGFAVIEAMKADGYMGRIPVLIITSEDSAEAEVLCLEMGASDFIHKPFERSIVNKRVRNAIRMFASKNELGQKIEEQREALEQQDRIIQIQAEKLKESEAINRLMMEYHFAIMEIETKFKVLNEEFSYMYKRNPFESIKSRLKSLDSIYDKLNRKGYPVTVDNIREHLTDVAGLRVICSFPDDIYRLVELFIKQDDIVLIEKKDYIRQPKPNGYRSLHLIVSVPVFLSNEKKQVKAEIQFRTIAMDFWASLEHKLKYKKDLDNAEEIVAQLKNCAESIEVLDYHMQNIRDKIDMSEKAVDGGGGE